MANHPSCAWRSRARASAGDWTQTTEARALAEIPIDPARSLEGMRNRLEMAYIAGYGAGRRDGKPRPE